MVAKSVASLDWKACESVAQLKGALKRLTVNPRSINLRLAKPHPENAPFPLPQLIKPRPARGSLKPALIHVSYNIHSVSKNLCTLAARNGGRNAVSILDRLQDSDGFVLVSKGIRCPQAYRDRLDPVPLKQAQRMIISDNAAKLLTR
jgi:hypothetical protein